MPIPRIAPDAPLREGLLEMSRKGLGMTVVVDAAQRSVLGVFTDGDLRRALDRQIDVHKTADEGGHDGRTARASARASWPPRRST